MGPTSVDLLERSLLEALEPVADVPRPGERLAELAIADDVDADLRLLGDDLGDGRAQARLERLLVVGLAVLLRAQERLQLAGAGQAADVRAPDPILVVHLLGPFVFQAGRGTQSRRGRGPSRHRVFRAAEPFNSTRAARAIAAGVPASTTLARPIRCGRRRSARRARRSRGTQPRPADSASPARQPPSRSWSGRRGVPRRSIRSPRRGVLVDRQRIEHHGRPATSSAPAKAQSPPRVRRGASHRHAARARAASAPTRRARRCTIATSAPSRPVDRGGVFETHCRVARDHQTRTPGDTPQDRERPAPPSVVALPPSATITLRAPPARRRRSARRSRRSTRPGIALGAAGAVGQRGGDIRARQRALELVGRGKNKRGHRHHR